MKLLENNKREYLNGRPVFRSVGSILLCALKKNTNVERDGIDHFWDHFSLYVKASPSAKSLLWISVAIHIEIRTHYHNKNVALRLALKERLRGTRKWSIAKTRTGHVFLVIASVLMLLESTENERNDRTQLDDFFPFRMGVIYNAHPKGKYLLVTPCLQVLLKKSLRGREIFFWL